MSAYARPRSRSSEEHKIKVAPPRARSRRVTSGHRWHVCDDTTQHSTVRWTDERSKVSDRVETGTRQTPRAAAGAGARGTTIDVRGRRAWSWIVGRRVVCLGRACSCTPRGSRTSSLRSLGGREEGGGTGRLASGLFGFAQDRCSRCAQKTTRPFSKDQRIPHTSWAAGLAPSCHMCATRIAARASRVSQPSPARRRSRAAATLPARASLTSTMHSRARCHAASPPRRLALLTSLGALLLLLLVLALMEPTHRLRLELVAAVRPVLVLVI